MTLDKKSYSVDMALTVTLNPRQFREIPIEQYRNTRQELEILLLRITDKYVIVPELTPKNQNIHYHILIKIPMDQLVKKKGPMYPVRNLFRTTKCFGYIDLKVCDDVPGWYKYITKDLVNTCNILDLIYDQIKWNIEVDYEMRYLGNKII